MILVPFNGTRCSISSWKHGGQCLVPGMRASEAKWAFVGWYEGTYEYDNHHFVYVACIRLWGHSPRCMELSLPLPARDVVMAINFSCYYNNTFVDYAFGSTFILGCARCSERFKMGSENLVYSLCHLSDRTPHSPAHPAPLSTSWCIPYYTLVHFHTTYLS